MRAKNITHACQSRPNMPILCRHLVDLCSATYESCVRTLLHTAEAATVEAADMVSMCQINDLSQKLETIMFV